MEKKYKIEDGEHKGEVIVSWIITHACQDLINSFDELITHYQVGKSTRNSVQRDNHFETRLSDKLTNFVSNIVAFFVSQKRVKVIPDFISVANKTCS